MNKDDAYLEKLNITRLELIDELELIANNLETYILKLAPKDYVLKENLEEIEQDVWRNYYNLEDFSPCPEEFEFEVCKDYIMYATDFLGELGFKSYHKLETIFDKEKKE